MKMKCATAAAVAIMAIVARVDVEALAMERIMAKTDDDQRGGFSSSAGGFSSSAGGTGSVGSSAGSLFSSFLSFPRSNSGSNSVFGHRGLPVKKHTLLYTENALCVEKNCRYWEEYVVCGEELEVLVGMCCMCVEELQIFVHVYIHVYRVYTRICIFIVFVAGTPFSPPCACSPKTSWRRRRSAAGCA